MKNFILIFIVFVFSIGVFASEFKLGGPWKLVNSNPGEAPVRFVTVDGVSYSHTQERYVFPNGTLSHTIDQTVKLTVSSSGEVNGSADFFDSRGCSYRNLKVVGEFQGSDTVALLMTIPRYKLVTITVGTPTHYERPIYCTTQNPYYPYNSYRYICGWKRELRNSRTECRLVETIEVPVELLRVP